MNSVKLTRMTQRHWCNAPKLWLITVRVVYRSFTPIILYLFESGWQARVHLVPAILASALAALVLADAFAAALLARAPSAQVLADAAAATVSALAPNAMVLADSNAAAFFAFVLAALVLAEALASTFSVDLTHF
jgi:hypothetical protein